MWMKHPALPESEPAEVQDEPFRTYWRHLGWEESDAPVTEEDRREAADLLSAESAGTEPTADTASVDQSEEL